MKNIIVGGFGFLGRHLTTRLVEQNEQVEVIGRNGEPSSGCDRLWFLAADTKNRFVERNASNLHYHTQPILRALNWASKANANFIFVSSAAVYGDTKNHRATETQPLTPNSYYGQLKAVEELLVKRWTRLHRIPKHTIFRPTNIMGPDMTSNILTDLDFMAKNAPYIRLRGTGTEKVSPIYVDDCISGMLRALDKTDTSTTINIGNLDTISVAEITQIYLETARESFKISWQGRQGIDCQLNIEKLLSLGWEPTKNSREATQLAARRLLE